MIHTSSRLRATRTARPRRALFCGIAAAALLAASAGGAVAQSAHTLHIPAGPLDASLMALAAQTHEQLLFSPELVAGRRAPAVVGDITTEQALAQLLRGSDIAVTRAGEALVLRRRPAPGLSPAATTGEVVAARPFGGEPAAETAPSPLTARPAPTDVEALVVTGTHIRGGRSATPVLVVTRDDLIRSGQTTVADALRALPQNFAGGAGEGTVTTGADKLGRNLAFSQGLNLRGLGNNATLVLVNGRRLGGSGAFGDFSDVSAIPTAAVERVEVLLDGASAIYGSDAVGGVVNIILRRDFEGAETRVLAGSATQGGASQLQLSQVLGRRWEGGGVLLGYEGQVHGRLSADDRRFTESADLRPLGGTDWRYSYSAPGNVLLSDPATGALVPGYAIPAGQNGVGLRPGDFLAGQVNLTNQLHGEDILPSQTLQTVYLTGHQRLADRLEVTADGRYSYRKFDSNLGAAVGNIRVTTANPYFVSPNGATSETISYSYQNDLANPTQSGGAETITGALGATLDLARDWRSEAYLTYAREKDDIRNRGTINSAFLNEALGNTADNPATSFSAARDGYFNPFSGVPGANNAAVLAFISQGNVLNHTRDVVESGGLQADGPLWRLPGGDLKLAIGAQARREQFARNGSTFVSAVNPILGSRLDVSRDVLAAFAELQAPLVGPDNARPGVQALSLSLAGRIERYDVVGSTTNPKVGVLWTPADGLNLRLTYGTSFRAPALREVSDLPAYSPTLLPLGGGQVRTLLLGGGNPDLKPETATSWTAGFDAAPPAIPGLTFGVTGYDIRFHNRIAQPVLQNLTGALTDPTLAAFVQRIAPASNAADLARITALLQSPYVSLLNGVFQPTDFGAIVESRYVNTADLHVRGLDVSGAYGFPVGRDHVQLAVNGSYTLSYKQQVTPTSITIDEVGLANFPVHFRGRGTADWRHGPLTATLAVNYTSAYHDPLGPRIRSQTTFDGQLRLLPAAGWLDGLAVTLNIRNLFDRDPPFYDNPAGFGYDPASGDAVGRFVSLELTRRW